MPTPYSTLDYIPDLTSREINSAITLTFENDTSSQTYDKTSTTVGHGSILTSQTYNLQLAEGEEVLVISTSYFDPMLRVYDYAGNAIAISNETDDLLLEIMTADSLVYADGGTYSLDAVYDFTAPYSGTYYIKPGWSTGAFFQFYGLVVSVDNDTAIPAEPFSVTIDRVFNWGESVYRDLFPEHQNSIPDHMGYHARIYSNGDALMAANNGNIYYYDGGHDGSNETYLVGTVQGFLPQAEASGF